MINQKAMNFFNRPILILGMLFFVFGFVTWLSSILIPYLKIACQLNAFESYLVAFSFYLSYVVMALPSAWILKKTGLKKGMSFGLFIMFVGTIIFVPAAMARDYIVFLVGLFVQGAGLALLQTAANPYVTIIGPIESAAQRISIMGICSGIAGVIAPLILGAIILDDADPIADKIQLMPLVQKNILLDSLAHRVILPYLIMAVVLIGLSLWVYFSNLPKAVTDEPIKTDENEGGTKKIIHFPHLLLGVLALFLYVGVEVIAGNTIIDYASFQGISISVAKFFTSFTLFGMLVGYLIGIICIPRFFSQETALKGSAILGFIFTIAVLLTHGYVSITFVALLGIANSLIWPSIWPLAIADLGKLTNIGSSLLVMAIGGGAILPLAYGKLADSINPQYAYLVVIPCYLFIIYFAVAGHKIRLVPKKVNQQNI